jgi:hypothetical protein
MALPEIAPNQEVTVPREGPSLFAGRDFQTDRFLNPPARAGAPPPPPPVSLLVRPGASPISSFLQSSAPPPAPTSPSAQTSSPNPTITVSKTNVQGPQTFIGQIPFFLNAVLSTPAGALPKGPLWVIVFDFDNNILNTIKSVKDYEPTMPEPWSIEEALNTVTSQRYQQEIHYLFSS